MKVTIKTMDRTGDTRVEFDLADPEAKAAAEKAIADARKRADLIVTVPADGKQGEVVRKVEDLAVENVVVPAIVAG